MKIVERMGYEPIPSLTICPLLCVERMCLFGDIACCCQLWRRDGGSNCLLAPANVVTRKMSYITPRPQSPRFGTCCLSLVESPAYCDISPAATKPKATLAALRLKTETTRKEARDAVSLRRTRFQPVRWGWIEVRRKGNLHDRLIAPRYPQTRT